MKALVFLAILVTTAFSLPTAYADGRCARCAIPDFEREYENSKAVFIGTVKKALEDGDRKIFEFEVEKYWKGVEESKVVVAVHENPRFEAQFAEGGRFLVFAKSDEEGGLMDGRCSRSKDLDKFAEGAEEDLRKLGPAKPAPGKQ
ncbi:MAG: hypothetical protein J5I65_14420 [Aridibacter famidurans]|nr:hypothetical protein [Aridibacter famidurans]